MEIITVTQRAEILTELITRFEKDTSRIYGSCQLLELIENIAIEKHFVKCPYCKR